MARRGIPMNLCPSDRDLRQLLAGDSPGPDVEPLRAHLAGCAVCQGRLDELSEHPDLRPWRGVGTAMPPADTHLCRLLEALRATPVTGSTSASVSEASDPLSGLGPPRQAGDLGTLG